MAMNNKLVTAVQNCSGEASGGLLVAHQPVYCTYRIPVSGFSHGKGRPSKKYYTEYFCTKCGKKDLKKFELRGQERQDKLCKTHRT